MAGAKLFGDGFSNEAAGFEEFQAYAGGRGMDQAVVYDAVLQLGGGLPSADAATTAWLYYFQQIENRRDAAEDEMVEAVDQVLAYWE